MKLHIYEGGIRVPAIVRWPGHAAAGKVIDQPLGSVDLLPTFCTIAGIDPPAGHRLDGTNLLPAIGGELVHRETPLFWFYYAALTQPKAALRTGDWKLVAHWDIPEKFDGVTPEAIRAIKRAKLTDFELYNLREDISEKHDLAADQPERVQKMAGELRGLFGQIQKEGPIWPSPKPRKTAE